MNRMDIEFWNGALKGVLGAEQELEEAAGRAGISASEGLKIAKGIIREYRRKMERMHARDIRDFLQQFAR